jgi:hypothetical protein
LNGVEHPHGATAILDIGRMDNKSDQMAECIGDDLAFAPLDRLAGIEAARPADFGRLHRLTVDYPGSRVRFTTGQFPNHCDKGVVDAFQSDHHGRTGKKRLHRGEVSELPWNLPPSATAVSKYKITSTIIRSDTGGGRPRQDNAGMNSSINDHTASMRLLTLRSLPRQYRRQAVSFQAIVNPSVVANRLNCNPLKSLN